MISDRMAEALDLLEAQHGPGPGVETASAAAAALGVDGLALSLLTAGESTELLWCSDGTARAFEDLQLTLGEGPGPDAVRTGAMVWVPDLARVRADRWPAMAMEAPDLDTRAVFCFPMAIGAIRVGVLTAVRRTPGPLTAEQADDAMALVSALTARCLGIGEPQSVPPDPGEPLHALQHAVVHQATGMVSVQLAVPLPQALLRLRAHAYGSGRSITDVSKDIVDRRLRLNHSGNGDGTPVPLPDKD